jgi:hypothetical protein
VKSRRDTLRKLCQLRAAQDVFELRLPDENDLQKSVLVGIRVG